MNQIEEYEERKKLRRSRFRWRILAALAVVVAIGIWAANNTPESGPHVARFDVTGVIVSDPDRTKLLRKIAEDDKVEGLLVRINSPGGTVTGSEELYNSLREIAAVKPVVATMTDVAASGGYITALAADHIIALSNTITGSVGVIFQAPNVHELMERIGVQMVEIKTGPLKAEPTPFKPVDERVIAAERVLVEDSFDWFVGLVRERRSLAGNAMEDIKRGGVFTGRMALDIGLIDEIGDADEARTWLAGKDVSENLELKFYEVQPEDASPLDLLFGSGGMAGAVEGLLEGRLTAGLWAIYR